MTQFKTVFKAAVLAGLLGGVAACDNPQSAPEPENETTAEMMPDTPDAATSRDAAAAGEAGLTPPVESAPGETPQPATPPAG